MNRDWTDHLRLHERVTQDDKDIQDKLNQFHRAQEPPRVVHLIAVDPTADPKPIHHNHQHD